MEGSEFVIQPGFNTGAIRQQAVPPELYPILLKLLSPSVLWEQGPCCFVFEGWDQHFQFLTYGALIELGSSQFPFFSHRYFCSEAQILPSGSLLQSEPSRLTMGTSIGFWKSSRKNEAFINSEFFMDVNVQF